MSTVVYNGITLPYSYCTQFSQEALYDEESGTDFYLMKFDIRVQSVVNANYFKVMAPDLPAGSSASDILVAIRSRLLKPRKRLSVFVKNQELIPYANSNTGTVDAKNGPQPQSCNIVQLTGESFLIEYHIVAHYWERERVANGQISSSRSGATVLYNRWTDTIDLDDTQLITRTRDGKVVIRSDNSQGQVPKDVIAAMAPVGVPQGFVRLSSQYIQTPDGLGLKYRVVDKEKFKMPPAPAFTATGTYTESSAMQGNAFRTGEVTVTLKGAKFVREEQLIQTAIAVAVNKIRMAGTNIGTTLGVGGAGVVSAGPGIVGGGAVGGAVAGFVVGGPIVAAIGFVVGGVGGAVVASNLTASQIQQRGQFISAAIRVNLYDNEVTVTLRAILPTDPTRIYGISTKLANIAHTPFSDPLQGFPGAGRPPYRLYGSTTKTGFPLQAAAYFDPSITGNGYFVDPATGQLNHGLVPGQAGIRQEMDTP